MAPNSCHTCTYWNPEPWDICPEQSDAWCTHENRRTLVDWRCEEWKERTNRDFRLAAQPINPEPLPIYTAPDGLRHPLQKKMKP